MLNTKFHKITFVEKIKLTFYCYYKGDNAKFELELEGHEDIFRVSPTVGQGSVTANIYVRDDSTLDYDELPRQYTLKVRTGHWAQGTRSSNCLPFKYTVTAVYTAVYP